MYANAASSTETELDENPFSTAAQSVADKRRKKGTHDEVDNAHKATFAVDCIGVASKYVDARDTPLHSVLKHALSSVRNDPTDEGRAWVLYPPPYMSRSRVVTDEGFASYAEPGDGPKSSPDGYQLFFYEGLRVGVATRYCNGGWLQHSWCFRLFLFCSVVYLIHEQAS